MVARGPPANLCYLCQWLCQIPGYPGPLHCLVQTPYTHTHSVITIATGTVISPQYPHEENGWPHSMPSYLITSEITYEKSGTNCVCQLCSPGAGPWSVVLFCPAFPGLWPLLTQSSGVLGRRSGTPRDPNYRKSVLIGQLLP